VLNQGSIVVRGGRIVSIAPGVPPSITGAAIDGKGMTAIAGFIDAHRHVNTGPNEKEQMQALLDAGYTTILSGGGPAEGNLTLRDHIEKGVIKGPRIIRRAGSTCRPARPIRFAPRCGGSRVSASSTSASRT